jgi:hypothetical protein
MAKIEHPLAALRHYLPEGAFEPVVHLINLYKVHLTVTKERKSVLGDYRHAGMGSNHKISVNGNLNKFEFLITLLHELAHLLCFEQHKNRVDAHGKEWKNIYSTLLAEFIRLEIFPSDIQKSLQKNNVSLLFRSKRFSVRSFDQMPISSWKSSSRALYKTRRNRFRLLFFSFSSKLFCWSKLPHQR